MSLRVIILAAGQGTRMNSNYPKVLHKLGGKPMVLHSVEIARAVSQDTPILVIGHGGGQVREVVEERAEYVLQAEQLGTGHAVAQVRPLLESTCEHIIVIYADMPLLQAETLADLYAAQRPNPGPITLLTLVTDSPRGFGRILRGANGSVQAIIEEAGASPDQLTIDEVNVGIYCFEADWLWEHLDLIPISPKGEYYLTDLVAMAAAEGQAANAIVAQNPDEFIGINTRVHLAEAEELLRKRVNKNLMLSGVTLVDPATTYIHSSVVVGQDTVIMPNTIMEGDTVIGADCLIGPNSFIVDSRIGDRCRIFTSVIEQASVEDDVDIGPYGHLRKGAHLESGVHMGNFGEVKNSRLRRGVKMGHFSYIGDGDIGENTNIGAGTITCNYDGKNKHKTITGKDVFIGSDTMLVAPVTLGDRARTGAGSVVTRDVPSGALVYGVPARLKPADRRSEEGKHSEEEG
nr:bifunctional UDP-N-acetylglucosamine diphosphorylase/glucosamine-1-phosphate N-acetyltransferase GlmU [Anaerolineae bacterium]